MFLFFFPVFLKIFLIFLHFYERYLQSRRVLILLAFCFFLLCFSCDSLLGHCSLLIRFVFFFLFFFLLSLLLHSDAFSLFIFRSFFLQTTNQSFYYNTHKLFVSVCNVLVHSQHFFFVSSSLLFFLFHFHSYVQDKIHCSKSLNADAFSGEMFFFCAEVRKNLQFICSLFFRVPNGM